jgi:hypothetical protein
MRTWQDEMTEIREREDVEAAKEAAAVEAQAHAAHIQAIYLEVCTCSFLSGSCQPRCSISLVCLLESHQTIIQICV